MTIRENRVSFGVHVFAIITRTANVCAFIFTWVFTGFPFVFAGNQFVPNLCYPFKCTLGTVRHKLPKYGIRGQHMPVFVDNVVNFGMLVCISCNDVYRIPIVFRFLCIYIYMLFLLL